MRPRNGTVDQLLDRANAEHHYYVRRSDLPLSCPMPNQYLWNAHPKVYLPIETSGGEAKCPYCGARYTLINDE
ncbi:MAG: zinc-finger domain-containing protein [Pseudomonadota bacterium]